jgi:hypothetical protein
MTNVEIKETITKVPVRPDAAARIDPSGDDED